MRRSPCSIGPKGAKSFVTLLAEALKQKVEIRENGRVRKITVSEGIVKRIANQALKGDIKLELPNRSQKSHPV
jgi:hypothetical protein